MLSSINLKDTAFNNALTIKGIIGALLGLALLHESCASVLMREDNICVLLEADDFANFAITYTNLSINNGFIDLVGSYG